jgi:hypothetical protein
MNPEVETHHHHHPTGHRGFDFVVPACALLISTISLVLALLDGRTMERMANANARLVQANSWPFLQFTTSNIADTGGPLITLGVVNTGVGPAKVETFEVFWNGRPVRNDRDLLSACCGLKPGTLPTFAAAKGTASELAAAMREASRSGLSSGVISPGVLEAHEAQAFLTLPLAENTAPLFHVLSSARTKVGLRACYCSVFDECWISNLRTMAPKPTASCPTPKVPFEY